MKILFPVLAFLFIVLAGCSSDSKFNEPPKINLGQDPCDKCYMIINEKKFAGTLWLNNGEAKRFDDAGEMIEYIKNDSINIKKSWVYDFISEEPVETDKAFYIQSDEVVTPMGFGVIAFRKEEHAKKYSEKYNVKIISYNQLKTNNNLE